MSSSLRAVVPVAWVLSLAGACSASSGQPAELGDCVKIGDASCPSPVTGGGGGGPASGGDDSGAGGEAASAGSCTNADTVLATQNTTCATCVEDNCCSSYSICAAQSGASGCLALVECMVGCTTNTSCQEACGATASSAATSDYDDLSSCLVVGQCTGCPTLSPPPTSADL